MGLFRILVFLLRHPLNRHRRVSALLRFFRWQIGSRLLSGPVACPFVNGSVLMIERGWTGATGNYYCGLHEYEDMAFVLKILRSKDVFIDVGANVGSYTVLAGSTGCRVFSFEPIEATYQRLRRNVLVNGYENRIITRLVGIGAASGELKFTTALDAMNHVVTGDEGLPSVTVPILALDCLELPDDVPVLIKIDVEGFEPSVLKGAGRLLAERRTCVVIMEMNDCLRRYGGSEESLYREMVRLGFAGYRYCPAESRLEALNSWNHVSANTLFLKDADWVRKRLRLASTFEINGVCF